MSQNIMNRIVAALFLQEMLINIKHVTFTALSTTKNSFFTEHLSLAPCPVHIAKFLRTAFL